MKTSTTVVDARAYSLASGETSLEIEHGMSPEHLADQLAQPLLVGAVDVGVEQADRDAVDAAAAQHRELLAGLGLVERDEHRAVGRDALAHAAAQVAGDQRARRRRRSCAASAGSVSADAGARSRPCPRMSRWPSVVRNPTFGSRRVMTALRPCVLAWLNTVGRRRRAPRRRRSRPVRSRGSVGDLGHADLAVRMATTSVNVPPTSTPIMLSSFRSCGQQLQRRTGSTARGSPSAGSPGT